MNLKDEAESVEKLAKDMEDRIRRAEEDSKERKEALERKIRGATLAEQERQQINSAGLGRAAGAPSGMKAATPAIAPWLTSRSFSSASISPSATLSRSKSMDTGILNSDVKPPRSKSRVEKAERNLKQVVIVNENEHSDEELHHDRDNGNGGNNLSHILRDAVLFDPNHDEENVFANHNFSPEFSNSSDHEHKPGSTFKGPPSARKQRPSSRDLDDELEGGDKPSFVKFASPPPKTRPTAAAKDRRANNNNNAQSNREAKLALDDESRSGGKGCVIN